MLFFFFFQFFRHSGQAYSLEATAAATPSLFIPTHRGWNQSSHREHISMNVSGLYGRLHWQKIGTFSGLNSFVSGR